MYPVTSVRLKAAINKLAAANPYIHCASIGTSRMGRELYALTIGHGEKTVLINAAHHANESITTPILMKFLAERAAEYTFCVPPKWADNVTLHIIPMVNPDGADLVNGGIGRMRKAYREAEALHKASILHFVKHSPDTFSFENMRFPDCWKANIVGVDLNSNYPANWEAAREHKFSRGFSIPCYRDYVGTAPLSEPETAALAAYTTHHDIGMTISLHTQGEEIYWQYPPYDPPRAREIAEKLAKASGYLLEEVPSESSHGGYRDWFISTFNRPGFTIECGLGENPLPLGMFDDMYKKVSPLLRETLWL